MQKRLYITVTNISDFRANAKQYIDGVINDANAVVINSGNSAAVLISLDEYNSIKATERLISLPKMTSSFSLESFSDKDYAAVLAQMSANRGKGREPKVGIFW